MTGSARQLPLDLPQRTAFGREDFLVTPSNTAAVALIDDWPNWPSHTQALVGPAGSGKSHLVAVWRERTGASAIAADRLAQADLDALVGAGHVAIEDAPGEALAERALFHLLNLARDHSRSVLLTGREAPAAWPVALPDLATRLRAVPSVAIALPDDALLRGVLVKHFADRQLAVEEAVISYLAMRMPRSLDAARAVVAEIDRQALEGRHEVTRAFAARVLARFGAPDFFDEER
jgi:chromosomal replication initiation ATPase DnaA